MKKIVHQRIQHLKEVEGTLVKEEWLEDRAVLSAIRNERMVECDFIETSRSCTLPRRINEYYDILERGIKLGIIVPQSVVGSERVRMQRIKGEDRFVIIGYNENGSPVTNEQTDRTRSGLETCAVLSRIKLNKKIED